MPFMFLAKFLPLISSQFNVCRCVNVCIHLYIIEVDKLIVTEQPLYPEFRVRIPPSLPELIV